MSGASFLTPARGGGGGGVASPAPAHLVNAELARQREEIAELYATLAEKDEMLTKSAEYGRDLIEQTTKLDARIKSMNTEFSDQVETLQQENHDMKVKLDNASKSIIATADLENENQALKEALTMARANGENSKRAVEKELREATDKVTKMEAEIKRYQLGEEQMRGQIKALEATVQELEEYALAAAQSAEQSEALNEARTSIVKLQAEKHQLQKERDDLLNQSSMSLLESDHLRERLEAEIDARADAEERSSEAHATLRQLKIRNTQLQDELASTLAKLENGGRREGTDLYSEVDDQRRALQKETITLKHKIGTQRKALELGDHHRRQLRNQVQMLSQLRGNKADTAKMKRLEAALSQSKSEGMQMAAKIVDLERQQHDHFDKLRAHHDAFSNFGDKKAYVEFLQESVEQKSKQLALKDDELRAAVMLQMSESSKLRDTERSLHQREHQIEILTTETMNLHMQLEDKKIMDVANAQQPLPTVDVATTSTQTSEEPDDESFIPHTPDSGVDGQLDETQEEENSEETLEEALSADAMPMSEAEEVAASASAPKKFEDEGENAHRRPLRDSNRGAKPAVEITVDSDQVNGAGECVQQ